MPIPWARREARRLFEQWWYPDELVYLHKREAFEWLFQTTGKHQFAQLTDEECCTVVNRLQKMLKSSENPKHGQISEDAYYAFRRDWIDGKMGGLLYGEAFALECGTHGVEFPEEFHRLPQSEVHRILFDYVKWQ